MTTRTFSLYLLAFGVSASLNLGASVASHQIVTSDEWCRDEQWGDDRQGFCEVREYTVPAAGATMTVEASPNGGIKVDGTSRSDILVRARIVATARTREEARAIASRVQVVATADHVDAEGPRDLERKEGWSVSYRLSVPVRTPLSLRTINGGVAIDNVNSRVEFRTENGGVKLSRMAGEVQGRTSNGGVDVELDGNTWHGAGLDVQTSNGGVRLSIPANYSARLDTGTVNGRLSVDFPVTVQGRIDRNISTDLGSGGPTLRVRTSNGGVRVTKK